jgi:hypothetical protein
MTRGRLRKFRHWGVKMLRPDWRPPPALGGPEGGTPLQKPARLPI